MLATRTAPSQLATSAFGAGLDYAKEPSGTRIVLTLK